MTASERSLIGLARQASRSTAQGFAPPTDADYKYFMFTQGGFGPQNMTIPMDQEVGGGAMLRGMAKVGVTATGQVEFIPRPGDSLGYFLLAALGSEAGDPVSEPGGGYTHTFVMGDDQFQAPYYSFRVSPGGIFGEEYRDCRIASLAFNWRAADYVRGSLAMLGGTPQIVESMATWDALPKVDGKAPFLAPLCKIEVPSGSQMKVLSGSFSMGMAIPLDEQFITGSYFPDDFAINSRMFALTLNVKIEDVELYKKMSYNPGAGNEWVAQIFREANIKLEFANDQFLDAEGNTPYKMSVTANGQSGNDANVAWSITPISMRAGRQIVASVTGMFLADPAGGEPVTVELTNDQANRYDA